MHELLQSRGFVRRVGDASPKEDKQEEDAPERPARHEQPDRHKKRERRSEKPSVEERMRLIEERTIEKAKANAKAKLESLPAEELRRAREERAKDKHREAKEFERRAKADREREDVEREVSSCLSLFHLFCFPVCFVRESLQRKWDVKHCSLKVCALFSTR